MIYSYKSLPYSKSTSTGKRIKTQKQTKKPPLEGGFFAAVQP
jgi:hypothetical protein